MRIVAAACFIFILPMVLALACAGCDSRPAAAPGSSRNEVIVMGTLHEQHRTSKRYNVARVREIIRRIDPDYVLCEIPPDRLAPALEGLGATGEVSEPHVCRFPEYAEALLPLSREIHFEIIPCSAWTQEMADARTATLERMRAERPDDYAESQGSLDWIASKLAAEGLADDPRGIHTPEYDSIVRAGMEPYSRLFNDALGPGGWESINKAHYALIAAALDAHRGEGRRFLIMFGAWHKYWLLDRLRGRDDILLRPLTDYLGDDDSSKPPM